MSSVELVDQVQHMEAPGGFLRVHAQGICGGWFLLAAKAITAREPSVHRAKHQTRRVKRDCGADFNSALIIFHLTVD